MNRLRKFYFVAGLAGAYLAHGCTAPTVHTEAANRSPLSNPTSKTAQFKNNLSKEESELLRLEFEPITRMEKETRHLLYANRLGESEAVLVKLNSYLRRKGMHSTGSSIVNAWLLLEKNNNLECLQLVDELCSDPSVKAQALALIALARNRKPADVSFDFREYLESRISENNPLGQQDLPRLTTAQGNEALGWLCFATALNSFGERGAAERLCRRSIQLQDSPIARMLLARMILLGGRASEARNILAESSLRPSASLQPLMEKLRSRIEIVYQVKKEQASWTKAKDTAKS